MITIIVGEENPDNTFHIPKALLCSRSKWFSRALEGAGFAESALNVVRLPDDLPEAFEAFYYYVYYHRLSWRPLEDYDTDGILEEIKWCFNAWIIGDKYDLPSLSDVALLRVCKILKWARYFEMEIQIPHSTLELAFQSTMPHSPLRRLAACYIGRDINNYIAHAEHVNTIITLGGSVAELSEAKDSFEEVFEFVSNSRISPYLKPYKHRWFFGLDNSGTTWIRYYVELSDRSNDRDVDAALCSECGISIGERRCSGCHKFEDDDRCNCYYMLMILCECCMKDRQPLNR